MNQALAEKATSFGRLPLREVKTETLFSEKIANRPTLEFRFMISKTLAAVLSRLFEPSQWRDIETAPSDRQLELAFIDGEVHPVSGFRLRHGDDWLDAETSLRPVIVDRNTLACPLAVDFFRQLLLGACDARTDTRNGRTYITVTAQFAAQAHRLDPGAGLVRACDRPLDPARRPIKPTALHRG